MIDMHTHILPGIDDGAKDESVSLNMLKIAMEHGTREIVATPHAIEGEWLPMWEEILEKTDRLNNIAGDNGINIKIYPGAEVGLNMDILKIISGPGPYCINGGRYMLVELPAAEIPGFAEEFFFQLQTQGITPVLAHPERHPEIAKDISILKDWIAKGILMQVNAPSLTGRMGKAIAENAKMLVNSSMVHCLGSDAHSDVRRRPILLEAKQDLLNLVNSEYLDSILLENAKKIINSEDIIVPEVKLYKQPQSRFQWLKSLFGA